MTRIGDHTPADLSQYRVGSLEQQVAQRLTMPERGLITELGAWLRGVSGNPACDYKLCVWSWDGSTGATNALLGQTSQHTASTASFGLGSLQQVVWALTTPLEVAAGALIMVGVASDTSSGQALQWGLRTGSTHYARDLSTGASWPAKMQGCYSDPNAGAFWVEDYAPISGAWVRRSGVWVRSDAVSVRRGAAWVDATDVQVRRSGVWIDAD